MTLAAHEFIRRFLLHVLPQGFHRIRHYGLFANAARVENLDRARRLLRVPTPQREPDDVNADEPPMLSYPRPSCGGRMIVIETFRARLHTMAPYAAGPATEQGRQARLKATPNRRFTRQDPPAPLQSRRDPTPPVSQPARSSRSSRPRNARTPPCHRQIPIDRAGRTAAPNPPRLPPLRLVRRRPTESAAHAQPRQASENP